MRPIIHVGEYVYLSHIWLNEETKYTPMVLASVEISWLGNRELGVAEILREEMPDGKLNILVLLADVQTGILLDGSELWIKPEGKYERLRQARQDLIADYIADLAFLAQASNSSPKIAYQTSVEEFYKKLPEKRPETIIKINSDDPLATKLSSHGWGWIK